MRFLKFTKVKIKGIFCMNIRFIKFTQVKTRAGTLAGIGLALDPEGKKSVLIQPSSFQWEKILKMFITVD